MALPANVSFGTVTGRFLTATADSPTDTDRDPEGSPATDLKITFSPNITPAVVRDASATPPTIFALAEIPATVGASGDLIGADGQPGIRLVATTGTTIDPSGWTWKVRLSSTSFPALEFSFSLDPGQTIDLATVVQVPASPGATLAAWLQAVADANAAADRAEAAAAGGGGGASDADIAALVTDPTAATGTALAARYLPAVGLGPRLVWFGDSITQGATDNENQSYGNSYPLFAQLLLRGRGWTVRNAGIGGNTTGAMISRFDTDVTPYAPNVVVILAGTNDIAQGAPLSYFQENITGIVAKVRAIGATPVLTTIPPIDLADRHAATSLYNLWLTRYAASIAAPLIDLYPILVDPATGNYRAGFSIEGVHPTPATMMLMGQAAADVLTDYLRPWSMPLVGANDDTLQILSSNPLFLADSNGDGCPDGFDHYGDSNATVSLVTDPAVPGKMVRLSAAGATGVHVFERYINTGFSAGDRLALAGVLTTDGGVQTQIKIDFQAAGHNAFAVNATIPAITRGIFYQEITVPAGTTPGSYLGFMIQSGSGTGFVQIGQFTVYNLTALGLA